MDSFLRDAAGERNEREDECGGLVAHVKYS
jgi:hypothetical protein